VAAVAAIGAAGLLLTQQSEGLRLTAYRDPVGIPTICYGHTGPDVKLGMRLTKQQCDDLLWQDIQTHQPVILQYRRENCIKDAPLTANQRDALTDFIINVGTGKFCRSTMARKLAARDYIGAADEFPKWRYANGKVLPGLVKRRQRERDLFVTYQRADARDVLSARAVRLLAAPLQ
jgi:lysozyme